MKEPVKNLLLFLGTLIFLMAMLEIITRYVMPPVSRVNITGVPKTMKMASPVPGIRYLLRNDGTATHHFITDPRDYFDSGATLTYETNRDGFRGPPVPVQKTAGTFRILGLGDSFTFGTGVRNEDTFLSGLQEKLNESVSGTDIEVLNLGAPAYNTVDEVNLLKYKGLKYQPDLVVICFFLNDTGGAGSAREFNRSAPVDEQPYWRQASRFLDYVAFSIERQQAAITLEESYRKSVEDSAPGWIATQGAIKKANRLSKEHNFDLVLMIFPVLWSLSDNYPFQDVHETVASFARQQSIPVLDLLPDFAGFDGPELWVHPNNQHPNEVAHEIAADSLANYIMKLEFQNIAPD
jgi:lysophospholipase L1-like esterase